MLPYTRSNGEWPVASLVVVLVRGVHNKPKPKYRTKIPKNWSEWVVIVPTKKSFNGTVTEPMKLAVEWYGYGYDF